jgi:CubicO group peptidase (beta-lactamase class C family)
MTRFTRLLVLVVFLMGSSCAFAQSHADKIDALMKKYTEYGQFNGSMLVAEKGEVTLKKGYGYANFEWDIPNSPDTKFRLGSITKQFTSMLIMQQVVKGTIKLEDPVVKYLPGYPLPQGEKVTVRHLLTHTSGTFNYTDRLNIRRDRNAYSLDSLIATFSGLPLEFEPGSSYKYSNSGYVLLGAILQKATGMPYERLLAENIFAPLGMKNSGYDHAEPIIKKRAAGYDNPVTFGNAAFIDMSVPFSAGALYSTVEDLSLWDRALYGEALLPKGAKDLYFTPGLGHYAFGWVVNNVPIGNTTDSVLSIWHGGGINGFNTVIMRFPREQRLIVLLNNTNNARLDEIGRAITGILYDRPYDGPRKSLADAFAREIESKGIAGALAAFPAMKALQKEYYMSEEEINRLGYQYLQQKKRKEAIEVFKLNVAEFPKSWNVYDSLGEAYLDDGQTAPAIDNYEKSVELNPRNTAGAEIVKKLKQK